MPEFCNDRNRHFSLQRRTRRRARAGIARKLRTRVQGRKTDIVRRATERRRRRIWNLNAPIGNLGQTFGARARGKRIER